MKKRVLALLLCAAMVFGLVACGGGATSSGAANPPSSGSSVEPGGDSSEPAGEKTLVAGITTAWTTLVATGGAGDIDIFIRSLLYDSLVNTDMDGAIHPRLASSWEADETGTVWTVHLNDKATWSDGTPVTANDVIFTYGLYATPGFCNFSTYVSLIDGCDQSGQCKDGAALNLVAQDDKTLIVTTKYPMEESLFWSTLQYIYIVPQHIYGAQDPFTINDSERWTNDPVTSGPYTYVTSIDGQSIEFDANPNYFLGAPNVDHLIVKVVAASAVASSLLSGDIDLTPGSAFSAISLTDEALLADSDEVVVDAVTGYNYRYLCINQKLDHFSDVRVRKALSMAINRDEIVSALLGGYGLSILTPYSETHPYYNSNLNAYSYDPAAAKALLEEAGWDFNREVTITCASNSEIRQKIVLMVQQYWQAIGVKVKVDTVDFPTMFAGLSSGEMEAGIMGQVGNATATEPIDGFTPGHAIDMSHLTTDWYYQTYLSMKGTGDNAAITSMCHELQQKIVDEVPYIYLVSEGTLQGYRSNVSNFDVNDANCRYWPVWEWDIG